MPLERKRTLAMLPSASLAAAERFTVVPRPTTRLVPGLMRRTAGAPLEVTVTLIAVEVPETPALSVATAIRL